MILHAALLFVRGGRDVEHVFDPVGAVGDLNLPPVVVGILEAAVPVHTEAEEIPIEAILGSAVLDDETRARHARAARVAWCDAQNSAVKLKRLAKIGGIDADVRDAGDGRSC